MNLPSLSLKETLTIYQGSLPNIINVLEKNNLKIEEIGHYIPVCVPVQDLQPGCGDPVYHLSGIVDLFF